VGGVEEDACGQHGFAEARVGAVDPGVDQVHRRLVVYRGALIISIITVIFGGLLMGWCCCWRK
jgi:hypothetical protein